MFGFPTRMHESEATTTTTTTTSTTSGDACPQVDIGANPLSYFHPVNTPLTVNMEDFNAGNPGTTWSVIYGSLPPGMSLNTSTGVISGTPNTTGSYESHIYGANSCFDSSSSQVCPITWDIF